VDLSSKRFFVQATLWPLKEEKLERITDACLTEFPHLKHKLASLLPGYQTALSGRLPEEITEEQVFSEGAVRRILINAYERDRRARDRCIEKQGTRCCICEVSFGEKYGPQAEGLIHIHHKRALGKLRKSYKVNPIEDLCPVCPNCHAVIHMGGKCREVEEVVEMLTRQKRGCDT
jgi:predicted HNH restriction endonuclease